MRLERRNVRRIARSFPCRFSLGGQPVLARVGDMSESGRYIHTANSLPVGTNVEVAFRLPHSRGEDPIRGRARVARRGPQGMGVEFERLSHRDRDRLWFFVAAVEYDDREPIDSDREGDLLRFLPD